MNLKPERVATGVTRVREWRSGVRAEAQEIKGTEELRKAAADATRDSETESGSAA